MGQPSKKMEKTWNVVHKNRIEDFSSYEEGLSSNGGSYAFFKDIYILKSGDEYRKLVLHSTSAQFEYCAITENFTSCQQCEVINCPEIGWFYASDSIVGYDEDGCINDGFLFLEDISMPIYEQEAEAMAKG